MYGVKLTHSKFLSGLPTYVYFFLLAPVLIVYGKRAETADDGVRRGQFHHHYFNISCGGGKEQKYFRGTFMIGFEYT